MEGLPEEELATPLVYDNSTATSYQLAPVCRGKDEWRTQGGVYRIQEDEKSLLIPFVQGKTLALLPSRALLVVSSAYLVVSFRLTSTFEQLLVSSLNY